MTPEDEKPELYCGLANEAPETPFNPWRDIWPGSWVLLRPEDPLICPVWQGRAVSAICREKGDVNPGKFLLQFWEPKSAERDLALIYRDCWFAKWVVEKSAPSGSLLIQWFMQRGRKSWIRGAEPFLRKPWNVH